jgi:hypothetical protein
MGDAPFIRSVVIMNRDVKNDNFLGQVKDNPESALL